MQSNEEKMAKTMPNAPYSVEQKKWFDRFVKEHYLRLHIQDLEALSNFITMNGGRMQMCLRSLEVIKEFLEAENFEFIDSEQVAFLHSLSWFISELCRAEIPPKTQEIAS